VTFGADHAYWFAQFNNSTLARLTADGAYSQVGGLSAGSGPREITAGPGGTLWVSLETAKKVARVSGVQPPSTTPPDPHPGPPVISELKLSRTKFRKGKRSTISFVVSEPATMRLSFEAIKRGRKAGGKCKAPARSNRRGKRCQRFVKIRPAITVDAAIGRNTVPFDGRLSQRKTLAPGSYRLTVGATDSTGLRSTALRARFRLLPRH
jgi:hypothetical protein